MTWGSVWDTIRKGKRGWGPPEDPQGQKTGRSTGYLNRVWQKGGRGSAGAEQGRPGLVIRERGEGHVLTPMGRGWSFLPKLLLGLRCI